MKTNRASGAKAWSDPDDAPKLTKTFFARAEIREGDKVVRPARGVLPPRGRKVTLPLDPDVVEALRATGSDWAARANEALRAAFGKR
jgi:uncharacterized protein (DUF4415 family)